MLRKISVFLLIIIFGISAYIPVYGKSKEDEKTIYLTFDDGPSPVTETVLDILDKNDIKATFFLIGCKIKYNRNMIQRIDREGHSIGLHSYTHSCRKLYGSRENFLKEMYMTRDELCEVTGKTYNIIRFPTGSDGHLNFDMLDVLHICNFRTFDWNMSISDGINAKLSPDRLFRDATSKENKPNTIFMLMHCDAVNGNTCRVLQKIIDYYKSEGYNFKSIKDDTREFYFPFKKIKSLKDSITL